VTIKRILERNVKKKNRVNVAQISVSAHNFIMAVKFGRRELKIPEKSRKQMLLWSEMRRREFRWTFTDVSEQPATPPAL
jgi:hypothetical protein